jgi:hypothetical protein
MTLQRGRCRTHRPNGLMEMPNASQSSKIAIERLTLRLRLRVDRRETKLRKKLAAEIADRISLFGLVRASPAVTLETTV